MPHAYHVLVGALGVRVDDFLISALADQGYRVHSALGREAIFTALDSMIDLLLLDLPHATDLPHLTDIRAACRSALIVIGPARNERLLIDVLEYGADDYVQRPFRTDELLARVRAQLRRRKPLVVPLLRIDALTIDLGTQQVRRDNTPIVLSAEEHALLAIFAAQPGFRYSVEYLIEHVWGRGYAGAADQIVAVVERLRLLLGDDLHAPRLIPGDAQSGYWLAAPIPTPRINTPDT